MRTNVSPTELSPDPKPDVKWHKDNVNARRSAYIIFANSDGIWWLRILKKGFRHCSILIEDETNIVALDPLSHQMLVNIHPIQARDNLLSSIRQHGHRFIQTNVQPAAMVYPPLAPLTCVSIIKHILGIQKRCLWTPFQLYRFLIKNRRRYKTA